MLDIKFFRQSMGACGPTSLRMVFDYYGLAMTEEEIIKLTNCDPEKGIEAEAIIKVGMDLGFTAFMENDATLNDLREYVLNKKIPVIIDWFSHDDGHYSVVVNIDNEYIYLRDPEQKEINKIDLVTFERVWFDFPGDIMKTKDDLILRRFIAIYR